MNKDEGQRLKKVLEWEQINQRDFAKKWDIPNSNISKYINGIYEIPRTLLEVLRNHYGISVEWLLFGTGTAYIHSKPISADLTSEISAIRDALTAIENKAAGKGKLKAVAAKAIQG